MRKLIDTTGEVPVRERPSKGKTGQSMKHESAEKHVTGKRYM